MKVRKGVHVVRERDEERERANYRGNKEGERMIPSLLYYQHTHKHICSIFITMRAERGLWRIMWHNNRNRKHTCYPSHNTHTHSLCV